MARVRTPAERRASLHAAERRASLHARRVHALVRVLAAERIELAAMMALLDRISFEHLRRQAPPLTTTVATQPGDRRLLRVLARRGYIQQVLGRWHVIAPSRPPRVR